MIARWAPSDGSVLRDILTGVASQDFVDQGLITDASPTCFPAELMEDSRIDADRDQLAGSSPRGGRPTRRIAFSCSTDESGISEKSTGPRTLHARGGSPAAR